MANGVKRWKGHRIRIQDVDPNGHFWGPAISTISQEQIFALIVKFCHEREDWDTPINKLELDKLWKKIHGDRSPRVSTRSLVNKGMLMDLCNEKVMVTHEFVVNAYLASPVQPEENDKSIAEAPREEEPAK